MSLQVCLLGAAVYALAPHAWPTLILPSQLTVFSINPLLLPPEYWPRARYARLALQAAPGRDV